MPKLIYKGLEVGGVSNEAIQCHFDNTGSNITSDNVEAALKELDSKTAGLTQVTPEEYGALTPEEKASGLYLIIDNKLSADGINPVQNKVIASAISTLNSNKQNNIYIGFFILHKTIPSNLVQKYRVDLTDLNLQGKRIIWGFAYQYNNPNDSLYEKAYITSRYDNANIYVSVWNGHDTEMAIPIMCVAFSV